MMSLRTRIAALAVLATLPVLGGCVSPVERRVADEELCRSYGFRPGSDGFAKCLQNIDLDRSANRREFLNRGSYGYGYGFGRGRFWY